MRRNMMWVLILVAVIALGAVGAERWKRKTEQDALAGCKANLKKLGDALEMYSVYNGGRFPLSSTSIKQLPMRFSPNVVPKYLSEMPTCPAAGTDTYSRSSVGSYEPDAYTLVCEGHHHAETGQGPYFPRYSSFMGFIRQ